MNPIQQHLHNGTDSPKLYIGDAVQDAPQEAITLTTNTADATYSSNEQDMLNEMKASISDLVSKLQRLGIVK